MSHSARSQHLPRLTLKDSRRSRENAGCKRRRVDVETSNENGITKIHKFPFHDEGLARFLGDDASTSKDEDDDKEDEDGDTNKDDGDDSKANGKTKEPISIDFADRTDMGPRDGLSRICGNVEMAVELGRYMDAEDILNLYCVSRDFHNSIRSYLLSSILAWIGHRAPEAGRAFPFKIYLDKLVRDPEARTLGGHYPGKGVEGKPVPAGRLDEVRVVPGLRYLQMVLVRDRCCREVAAVLACSGHRLPRSMHGTLLRLWVLMDLPTSLHRRAVMRNEAMWPDVDMYNAQLFFVKLGMHFNDPVYGPGTNDLVRLVLGQRGLYPLWQLLMRKKYVSVLEVIELKTRYDMRVPPDTRPPKDRHKARYVNDVPVDEVGIVHLEGWGTYSPCHLLRPDELVPLGAVERGLDLRSHLRRMIEWGHIDHRTGENRVPTEEEMYISDEERALAHMDTTLHWKKKHARKKRWSELSPQQQREIREDDEDERLRLLAWAGTDTGEDEDSDSDHDSETYDLNDEIDRAFIPPDTSFMANKAPVPALDDKKGWSQFVNKMLMAATTVETDKDEELRNQSIREHLNLRRTGQKEDLPTWHD